MKVVGMAIVGPNEPYLKQTLECFKRLCDETIICFCNATSKEKKLVKEYGFHTIEDNREWGVHQWLIKETLLREHVAPLKPDWVIPLDADEVFDSRFNRQELETLASKGGLGYYFYVVNLYNEGYSKEWSRWNIRMFRFAPEHGLEYERKPVHCGLAPRVCYFHGNYAPFLVKHYGLKEKASRDKRVERYQKYDPKASHLHPGYYQFLASEAPVSPFDEDTLHEEVAKEVADYKFKNPKVMENKNTKFFYVQTPAGTVVDIPESHLAETLSRKGFKLVEEVRPVAPVEAVVEKNPLECEICGFLAKTPASLKTHGKKHQ